MKIVCFSDTHKLQNEIKVPSGDVLLFAGDMCGGGGLTSVVQFNHWIGTLPHKHKIVIAGNHDRCFENNLQFAAKEAMTNCDYLEDSEIVIDGVKFYGSPWQPFFCSWAFNLERGKSLEKKWAMIPDDVDVLITHGPPHGILDVTIDGEKTGCEDLLARIKNLSKLKYHIFGHIHEGYGTKEKDGVKFINASVCTFRYEPINAPIVVEL